MDAIKFVQETNAIKPEFPKFQPGDNVTVHYKIIEGTKERIQAFKGNVIQTKGQGATATFTVRKISGGTGVERIFPYTSPNIVKVEVNRKGAVRRAKLFYLRKLKGKKSRIKERRR